MATMQPSHANGYAINWNTVDQRIKDAKEFLMTAPQVLDPQRLQFLPVIASA